MTRYFVTLSYDGSNYHGWQIQQNTPNTIQQVLETNLSLILGHQIAVTGCGRTDTGVHAKNYVAHIDLTQTLEKEEINKLIYKLNKILPKAIAIHGLTEVKETAHARFDATERTYYYYLSQQKNPFRETYTYHSFAELDFELMNDAAHWLLQFQDFKSFSKLNTQNKTTLCQITYAKWICCGEKEWLFKIKANRFLRGMVRAIVGTLIQVGKKQITVEEFKNIIEAKDRKFAGPNVPAKALFLCGIQYPKNIYN